MAIAGSEEKEDEEDRYLIYIVGHDRGCDCLCRCLNNLDLAVYGPTKINLWVSPKKLLMGLRWPSE